MNVQENLMDIFMEDAIRILFGEIEEEMGVVPGRHITLIPMVETNLVIARYSAGNATKTQEVLVDK